MESSGVTSGVSIWLLVLVGVLVFMFVL